MEVTATVKDEVVEEVYEFFSEECEVERSEMSDDTHIIRDLDGDSLMFLELLEIFKKKYDLDIELKAIGKYVVKHPAETIAEIVAMSLLIIEHGNAIADLD